ncbi:MAG: hypothetical protein QOJ69_129, partial [Actinomycetota bacterium]|nr:hypothetical protein [Actinomycetota bacterium]
MTDHHRHRAAFLLVLMVAGTAAMGLTVWATTPPAASARAVGTRSPAATTAVSVVPTATLAVPACTPAPLAERAARTLIVGLPGVTAASDPLVGE